MGIRSQMMHDQATDKLAEAIVNLFAEEFSRGSDSLGEEGWRHLAAACHNLSASFHLAAGRIVTEVLDDPTEGTRYEHLG